MAGPEAVSRKVLELKKQLSHTQDPSKIMKVLKGLQVLEISLDTLVETGVGKIINSFRKHPTVGNLAKSLICHWKKLVPQGHASELPKRKSIKGKDSSAKNERKLSLKENNHLEKSQISTPSCKTLPPSCKQKKLNRLKDKQRNEDSGCFLSHLNEEQSNNFCQNFPRGLEMNSSKHINKEHKERPKSSEMHSSSKTINRYSKKSHSLSDERKDSSSLKAEKYGKANPKDTGLKGALKLNSEAKSPSNEDFEPPTMSFESYLNYDQVSSRKKRKTCPANKQVVNSNSASPKSVALSPDEKKEETLRSDDLLETPIKKAKTSLQDLLNTPLPKLLPEIVISSSYATEFKAPPAVTVPQQRCDTVQFTGQRVNSKMQVYSGSKTTYLSKMLTLYEQCIRVLQNNIDSLHDVGRVPFDILEPVLTRCTSEQLFQIEDCNSMFIERSDHLWKKHCQRDFRNERPLEYESWREMYLRVFNQREEKLKSLTRSILLAQSEKPKGRQVKMAFVHCMVKPPRNVRHLEEICGTASSIQSEMQHPENGDISASFNKGSSAESTSSFLYATGMNQNGKTAPKSKSKRLFSSFLIKLLDQMKGEKQS